MKGKISNKGLLLLVESGGIALLFLLAFAFGLSPLYRTFGWDNATFLYIGKAIAEGGLIPYVEISDNKGILFLSIQALGQWLSPDRWGSLLIFYFIMWMSVYLMFLIARMRLSLQSARSVVVVVLLFYTVSLADGNLTEDFALPIVLLCYWLFLKYSNWCEVPFDKVWVSFVVGLSISLTALLRFNNCVAILPLLIYPFLQKRSNALSHFVAIGSGLFAPVFLVLLFYGLDVFVLSIDDTFLYNLKYVEEGGGDWSYWNVVSVVILVLNLILIFRRRHNYEKGSMYWIWIMAHLATFTMANLSKRYSHYQTLIVPFVLFGFVLLFEELSCRFSLFRQVKRFHQFFLITMLLLFLLLFIRKYSFYRTIDEISADPTTEMLLQTIPKEERNQVALFNIPIHFAYKAGLYTTNPYCFSSVQMASISYPKYEYGVVQSLLSEQTLWLITTQSPDFTSVIDLVVKRCYIPFCQKDGLIVWKRQAEESKPND